MLVRWRLLVVGLVSALFSAACTGGADIALSETSVPETSVSETSVVETTTTIPEPTFYFATLEPGSVLPDDEECAEKVLVDDLPERRPENAEANAIVGLPPLALAAEDEAAEDEAADDEAATDPDVDMALAIDGADEFWNAELAPRITGDFSGSTEQILRWGACKWGFDEEVTRARAVTESSWRMSTAGDETEDPELCGLIELESPCAQSYGLLQVKGTVHTGTYPLSSQSSAFGVDYAMAWLRACYEGSFEWLIVDDNDDYAAGDEFGCVGAWFSGNWLDQGAQNYIAEVRGHLEDRTWLQYEP